MTTLFVVAAAAFILYFLLSGKKPKNEIVKPATDNNCRPHEWKSMKDIIDPAFAIDVTELLKLSEDKYAGSAIDAFAKGLTCRKCGYISGTEVMIDLTKWEDTIRSFLFVESEKQLVKKYIKRDEKKV